MVPGGISLIWFTNYIYGWFSNCQAPYLISDSCMPHGTILLVASMVPWRCDGFSLPIYPFHQGSSGLWTTALISLIWFSCLLYRCHRWVDPIVALCQCLSLMWQWTRVWAGEQSIRHSLNQLHLSEQVFSKSSSYVVFLSENSALLGFRFWCSPSSLLVNLVSLKLCMA